MGANTDSLSVLVHDLIHTGNFDIFQVDSAGCPNAYLTLITREHVKAIIAELVPLRWLYIHHPGKAL